MAWGKWDSRFAAFSMYVGTALFPYHQKANKKPSCNHWQDGFCDAWETLINMKSDSVIESAFPQLAGVSQIAGRHRADARQRTRL